MATKKRVAAPVVDIDAAEQKSRAEREAKGELVAPVVAFHGEKYQLVDDLPLDVILALSEAEETDEKGDTAETAKLMVRSIRSLFADGEWERFLAARPSFKNLLQMFDLAFAAYAGMSLGESEASEKSSSDTGTPARRPSSPATA